MRSWLCFGAAAYEPRIRRVIAVSVRFDYMLILPLPVQTLVKVLLQSRRLMNYLARLKMNVNSQERLGINNLMYITKTTTPMDAPDELLQFNEHNLH